MKAAKRYKRQHGPTVEQENAIDLLITGITDVETAEEVGVHRVTVTKWRLCDPWFQTELSRRRVDPWGASAERLRAMLPKALHVLEKNLSQGPDGLRAALEVIKICG